MTRRAPACTMISDAIYSGKFFIDLTLSWETATVSGKDRLLMTGRRSKPCSAGKFKRLGIVGNLFPSGEDALECPAPQPSDVMISDCEPRAGLATKRVCPSGPISAGVHPISGPGMQGHVGTSSVNYVKSNLRDRKWASLLRERGDTEWR